MFNDKNTTAIMYTFLEHASNSIFIQMIFYTNVWKKWFMYLNVLRIITLYENSKIYDMYSIENHEVTHIKIFLKMLTICNSYIKTI